MDCFVILPRNDSLFSVLVYNVYNEVMWGVLF